VCSLVTKAEAQAYLPPIKWVYFQTFAASPATKSVAGSLCGYYPFASTAAPTGKEPIVVVILDKGKQTIADLRARVARLHLRAVRDTAVEGLAYYQANEATKFLYVLKHGTLVLIETRGLRITKEDVEHLAGDALSRLP